MKSSSSLPYPACQGRIPFAAAKILSLSSPRRTTLRPNALLGPVRRSRVQYILHEAYSWRTGESQRGLTKASRPYLSLSPANLTLAKWGYEEPVSSLDPSVMV
ncbi:hypothetical protein BofuT4_P138610.1 [Botrytis cinerea T4]|uniref:Uncharacterized protein n=1 Tax=Botryotinia fuckeliana (strain T4) TaxID=999810 RepID=G2YMT9_BOTF4|nr:hypothetical protein BofuT4_P138610.1 [Botrytis cinerea T4]